MTMQDLHKSDNDNQHLVFSGERQKKAIIKTVLILVVVMSTILLLFLNKITTPRYLSTIELKINGLELLKAPYVVSIEDKELITNMMSDDIQWLLVASDAAEMKTLEGFHQSLKRSVQKQVAIVMQDGFPDQMEDSIALVKLSAQSNEQHVASFMAYLKAPYDYHKMTLTLASVITHR